MDKTSELEDDDLVSILNFEIPFRDLEGYVSDEMARSRQSYEDDNSDSLF